MTPAPSSAGCDERGEAFPVAILFGGVLLTILIGVHVVLFSIASTAVQSAADRGVAAAQAAPLGPTTCGTFSSPGFGGAVTPASERECQGLLSTWTSMNAARSMVLPTRLPSVAVDEQAGIVSVISYGAVDSPVLGRIEVAGHACGVLDLVEGTGPTRADLSSC